jgi:Lecithin:cholesterol acyltransferase.
MRRIAVFIPGIMGSVLEEGSVEIWSKSAWHIYGTLVNNPGKLAYKGSAAKAIEILDSVNFAKIKKNHLYTGLIDYLKKHPDYSATDNCLLFPYDWRQGIDDTLNDLKKILSAKYGISYNSYDKALRQQNVSFTLIGHSMGGIIALLAANRKIINPKNIEAIILIGSPLSGAPSAFRSMYEKVNLPVIDAVIGLWWGKNAGLAMNSLSKALHSFPSIYSLFPPKDEHFVWIESKKKVEHPFKHKIFDAVMVKKASQIHREIRMAMDNSKIAGNKLFLIYGTGLKTDELLFVHKTGDPNHPYHFALPYSKETIEGDRTVTMYSATFKGRLQNAQLSFPVVGTVHSNMCNDRKVIDIIKTIVR